MLYDDCPEYNLAVYLRKKRMGLCSPLKYGVVLSQIMWII